MLLGGQGDADVGMIVFVKSRLEGMGRVGNV